MKTYYEDPTGVLKNVAYPVDTERERELADARAEQIESKLDDAVGRGSIQVEGRSHWRTRLHRNFEEVSDILDELPADAGEAARAHQRDPRLRDLADGLDALTGVTPEERVREYDDSELLPIGEQLERKLDSLTNAHLFR